MLLTKIGAEFGGAIPVYLKTYKEVLKMAREINNEGIEKFKKGEKSHIRVLCWDGKKQIFDYVPVSRLRELIDKEYVLAAVE